LLTIAAAGGGRGVRGVAFDPRGQELLTGSDDGAVRIFDASSGQLRVELVARHDGWAQSVAFSPDGALVAAAVDYQVRVWTAEGTLRAVLRGPTWVVSAVAFGGRRWVAGASWDQTIWLWDLASDGPDPRGHPLPGHGRVRAVAFDPEGTRLVSGGNDGAIRIWSVPDGRLLATRLGHTDAVVGVAFSSDGKLLVSAGEDQTIRVRDPQSGVTWSTRRIYAGPVRSIAFVPQSRTLAVAVGEARSGTVELIDLSASDICLRPPPPR
jgi:WD40 repeat protein